MLTNLFGIPGRGALALAGFALVLMFAVVLFPAVSARSGSPANRVTDLQRAFTIDQFVGVLRRWSAMNPRAVGIIKYDAIIRLDFVFPLLYGFALAFAYAALSGRWQPAAFDRMFFTMPFAAAAFDFVENLLHLYLLRGITNGRDVEAAAKRGAFNAAAIAIAWSAAHLKFAILLASLIGLAFAAGSRFFWIDHPE